MKILNYEIKKIEKPVVVDENGKEIEMEEKKSGNISNVLKVLAGVAIGGVATAIGITAFRKNGDDGYTELPDQDLNLDQYTAPVADESDFEEKTTE